MDLIELLVSISTVKTFNFYVLTNSFLSTRSKKKPLKCTVNKKTQFGLFLDAFADIKDLK
jgi:hypothetical protein